jgi:phospholipid/cholesterol/gamma-HCH transport system substrate-binding protein
MFVLLGTAGLAYLSVSIGGTTLWPTDRYEIRARFATVGDLAQGAVVKLAGVPVGEVTEVRLDKYAALVSMRIERSLPLPKDTIASVKTAGLLGEAYVSLSPGGADKVLVDGNFIAQTEAPLDLFELIGKYAFESDGDEGKEPAPAEKSPFADPLE